MSDLSEPRHADPPPSRRRSRRRAVVLGAPGRRRRASRFRYVATGAGTWYAFTDWDGISRTPTGSASTTSARSSTTPRRGGRSRTRIKLAFTFVVTANVIGLALALALHRTLKSRGLLRAIFFVPVVMSSLAVSYVWQFIFSYTGPLNGLLDALGLESPSAPGRATRRGRSGRSSSSSSGSSSVSRW